MIPEGLSWVEMRLPGLVAGLLCLIASVLAAGCSPRPPAEVLVPAERAPMFTPKARLLVATTRAHPRSGDPDAFTAERADMLNFADVTVSIPTRHKPGEIEWPDQTPPDPALHFITVDRASIDRRQFLDANGACRRCIFLTPSAVAARCGRIKCAVRAGCRAIVR